MLEEHSPKVGHPFATHFMGEEAGTETLNHLLAVALKQASEPGLFYRRSVRDAVESSRNITANRAVESCSQ